MDLREELNKISVKYQNGDIIKIIDRNGNLIKLNKDSDQYRNLYNNKLIQGYDPKTDTYYLTPTKEKVVYNNTAKTSGEIPEIVLKGKKADWVKYKEDYIKNNPKEKYIQEYLDAYPWAHQSLTNYPKRLDESYENMVNNYIGEQIVKNKPQGNKSREEWLNSLSEQEQRFVQRNPKYGTTLWQDAVEGGKALFNLGNDLQISRIKNSDNYTNLEKKDLIQQHEENPILSNIGDVAQSLSFLTVPSKMVQSVLRPEYSFSDAVQGTKNKAGMLEDIGTDPLNLVGAEFFNKFDDINKIIKPLNSLEGINKINQIGKEKNLILEASQFKEDLPFLDNIKNFFRKEEGVPLKIKQNISDYKTRVIYDNQDIPEGYVKFNQLKVDDLSKIQKDSYVQLGSTLKSLYKNEGKGVRTSADIFYNPSKGFIVKPVNGIEHILNTDSEILNHLDKVTNGNSRVIKSVPYTENELSTINNKARLSLDGHRFFSNTLAKDDKYLKNASHYSKNKISPLEIIKQNDNKYQEAKTFLQNRVNEIHDEYDLDKLKKIAYYKSENPTINDVLNVKNKVLENIEKSISKNGNKHVRDVLINKINNSPYDELSEVVRDIDLNTTIKNAQAITPKTAYASVDEGVPYMFIKSNNDDPMDIPHEFGHNMQRSLDIKDITNLDKDIIKELEVNGTDHFKKLTDPYILREYGNGRRSEPAAFFSEVKEDMRNKGFIKSRFDGIKPEVFDNYLKTDNKPDLTKYMRKEPLFNLLNKYYSTIPIAGGIGYGALNSEDETQKYQDGGIIDRETQVLKNTVSDDNDDLFYAQKGGSIDNENVKNFYNDMLNAPWYKERLNENGYMDSDVVISKRLKNINRIDFSVNNSVNTGYSQYKNLPQFLSNPHITLNTNESDFLNTPYNDSISHEYGHGETKGSDLSEFEKSLIEDSYISNSNDEQVNYLKSPYETKSDINAIRYHLYNMGKYNPKTGEYDTESKLFEPSLLDNELENTIIKRMKEAYGKDNLKMLMNTVADNHSNNIGYNA